MALLLPNTIENDTPADAAELQQNFAQIQTYVNTNVLHRDGSVAIENPLLLPGDPTQDNHAANKGYVDGRDVLKLNKNGDEAMTGPLTVETAWVGNRPDSTAQALFTHKDSPGDATGYSVVADGALQAIPGVGENFTVYSQTNPTTRVLRMSVSDTATTFTDPVIGVTPTAASHLTRKDYVDTQVATALNQTEADARYVGLAGGTMTGSLSTAGNLSAGSTSPAHSDNGVIIRNDGHIHSAVNTGTTTTTPNMFLTRGGGAPNDIGGRFVTFFSGTTSIGNISIGPASNQTDYNTSSDYRLKDELGPVDAPVERLMRLQPKHLRWKVDGYEFDGFIAHEVQEVVPNAATGEKDAVLPDDDEFDPGGIDPQQLDTGKLIPLLVAALQNALERIAVLEAA